MNKHREGKKLKMITHRFGDKANRSRPVELALNYVIDRSSCITYLKSSSLNTSNSSRANNNLKYDHLSKE